MLKCVEQGKETMKRLITGIAPITFSAVGRAALLTSVLGAGLLAATTGANAQSIRVWSGYPELAPFYEHVAEGMKAEYPDISVTVEAIALREHERRVALGITSGESAEVLELATSIAARYLENDLLATPPADVAAFVADPLPPATWKTICSPPRRQTSRPSSPIPPISTPSSSTRPAMAAMSLAFRCSAARARSITTPPCSKRPALMARPPPWKSLTPMPRR